MQTPGYPPHQHPSGAPTTYNPHGGHSQYPSHPPYRPAKQSNFIPFVLAFGALFFGSCALFIGYELYEEQRPEGKAERAAKDKRERETAQAALGSLGKMRAGITGDAVDAPKVMCPNDTIARDAPVVDSRYLDRALGETSVTDTDIEALEHVRSGPFSDDLSKRVDAVRTNAPKLPFFGDGDAKTLLEKRLIVVLDVEDLDAPKVDGNSFEPGSIDARALVMDRNDGKVLCASYVHAESSEQVEYGGGMRLKVKGIPSPTVGKTSLKDAVMKDFSKNVNASLERSLREIGAWR